MELFEVISIIVDATAEASKNADFYFLLVWAFDCGGMVRAPAYL